MLVMMFMVMVVVMGCGERWNRKRQRQGKQNELFHAAMLAAKSLRGIGNLSAGFAPGIFPVIHPQSLK